MAKDASLFLAKSKGKIGEVVFYRAGGTQRARQYIKKIRDKKSLEQYKQRTSMANKVTAYGLMKSVISNTFPTRETQQSAYNAFIQVNAQLFYVYFTKSQAAIKMCFPNGLQCSKGSLTSMSNHLKVADDGTAHCMFTKVAPTVFTWKQFISDYMATYTDATIGDKIIFSVISYGGIASRPIFDKYVLDTNSNDFPDGMSYTAEGLTISGIQVVAQLGYAVAIIRYNNKNVGSSICSSSTMIGSQVNMDAMNEYLTPEQLKLAASSYGYDPNSL